MLHLHKSFFVVFVIISCR